MAFLWHFYSIIFPPKVACGLPFFICFFLISFDEFRWSILICKPQFSEDQEYVVTSWKSSSVCFSGLCLMPSQFRSNSIFRISDVACRYHIIFRKQKLLTPQTDFPTLQSQFNSNKFLICDVSCSMCCSGAAVCLTDFQLTGMFWHPYISGQSNLTGCLGNAIVCGLINEKYWMATLAQLELLSFYLVNLFLVSLHHLHPPLPLSSLHVHLAVWLGFVSDRCFPFHHGLFLRFG